MSVKTISETKNLLAYFDEKDIGPDNLYPVTVTPKNVVEVSITQLTPKTNRIAVSWIEKTKVDHQEYFSIKKLVDVESAIKCLPIYRMVETKEYIFYSILISSKKRNTQPTLYAFRYSKSNDAFCLLFVKTIGNFNGCLFNSVESDFLFPDVMTCTYVTENNTLQYYFYSDDHDGTSSKVINVKLLNDYSDQEKQIKECDKIGEIINGKNTD